MHDENIVTWQGSSCGKLKYVGHKRNLRSSCCKDCKDKCPIGVYKFPFLPPNEGGVVSICLGRKSSGKRGRRREGNEGKGNEGGKLKKVEGLIN